MDLLIIILVVIVVIVIGSIKQINEYERGIKFLDIDLYKSHHDKFIVEEDGIRPPLNSIPGLGPIDAESIYNARQDEAFECVDDLQSRSKIGKVAVETLQKAGLLKGMTKSNQMSLFSF